MNRDRIMKQLGVDEGRRSKIYLDTEGKWTGGVGRNLTDRGLREDEIDLMLKNDLDEAIGIAKKVFKSYEALDDVRQEVVVNMAFNLGETRLRGFKRFIAAVNRCDFLSAADEMVDSKWYRQVGDRGKRLMNAMKEGRFQ